MCREVCKNFPGNQELLDLFTHNIFTHFTEKNDTEIGPKPSVCCWGAHGWGRCSTFTHLHGDAAPCMAGAKGMICGKVLSETPVLVRNTGLKDHPAGFSLCCLDGDLVGWD